MIHFAPRALASILLAWIISLPLVAAAQEGSAATARQSGVKTSASTNPSEMGLGARSILTLVRRANPMLWPLALCSVVALGFSLERLIALRRSRVAPRDFVERFLERLSSGKLDRERALELCRAHDSPVSRIFSLIVTQWGQPAGAIRLAVGQESGTEVADLKRNVRVLNGTATLAPLLGLLGTVIGMIEAFDALGGRTASGVTKGEQLAHGISLSLLTTAGGLGIAIVSVAVYYYLLNRVDLMVRELDVQARRAIDLVAAEAGRSIHDRRVAVPADHIRGESRTLGRSEPV